MYNMKNREDSHYTILGIDNNASYDDIKKAYRKLSLEYHPDRNGGDKVKCETYKKITEAYKVLSDENERKKYDFKLNPSLSGINIDPSMFMSMLLNPSQANNILEELEKFTFTNLPFNGIPLDRMQNTHMPFNNINSINKGFSQHQYSSKPATIFKNIKITLLQAYNGCKIPITLTRWIVENDIKIEQTETIYINIPKGVDNDEIITIINKGNRITDTNKGDIEIKVSIKKHDYFERNGIDLIFKKSITLKESLCGFSFDLTYIDGKEFKINNKAGNVIPQDFRKIIPKMGMQREDDIGNLIIIFDVVYPKHFTREQLEELEKTL